MKETKKIKKIKKNDRYGNGIKKLSRLRYWISDHLGTTLNGRGSGRK